MMSATDPIQPRKNSTNSEYPSYSAKIIERLQTVLSPRAMVQSLNDGWCYAEHRKLSVKNCCAIRVYPRGEHEFVIEFEVKFEAGHRSVTLFGELLESGAEDRLEALLLLLRKRKRRQLSKKYETDRVTCLRELGLILRFPGLDEKLVGLKLAYDRKTQQTVLPNYFGTANLTASNLSAEFLGHRLGKRAVFRLTTESTMVKSLEETDRMQSVIAKAYKIHDDKGRRIYAYMQDLCKLGFGPDAMDGIQIPQPIAFFDDFNVMLMEDIGGQLPSYHRDEHFEACGRALAKLHATPLKLAKQHSVDDEIALLHTSVSVTIQIFPVFQHRLNATLRQVKAKLNRCQHECRTLVHRDFYEKQILITPDRLLLIDFDTLCLSDPALDVGNFLAHLHLAELQGLGNASRLEKAFLDGYRPIGLKVSSERIDAYVGATLLRLACLYTLWPRWKHLTTKLLDRIP